MARIAEVEFGGNTSLLTLELSAASAAPLRIAIRHMGLDIPAPGTTVRIAVAGFAHVFAHVFAEDAG
jgi:hypothetical protein